MTNDSLKNRKIQTTKSGARYVWRVSKKTGKRYKQYIPRKTRIIHSPYPAAEGMVFVPFR